MKHLLRLALGNTILSTGGFILGAAVGDGELVLVAGAVLLVSGLFISSYGIGTILLDWIGLEP